jgi:hypothetical protein
MKKNHTFSNLPMAAIVLLIASLPCLAQATTTDSTSALAVAENTSTLTLNNTLRTVRPSTPSIEDTAITSKSVERKSSLNLTAATFKVSEQLSMDSKFVTRTQLNTEVAAPDSKEQFRLDNDTTTNSKVTFVPSRGYKLPNY